MSAMRSATPYLPNSPLGDFNLPEDLREHVPDLAEEVDNMHKSMVLTIKSAGTEAQSDDIIRLLIDYLEQQNSILKRGRARIWSHVSLDGPTKKKMVMEINKMEDPLIQARAYLTIGMKFVSNDLLVNGLTLASIARFMNNLYNSDGFDENRPCFFNKGRRGLSDYIDLQNLLVKVYSSPQKVDDERDSLVWCPVMDQWDLDNVVDAAHIVPVSVGVRDFAYLTCIEADESQIYARMFGADNAILLHRFVKRALDTGKIVIVPTVDDKSGTEYECIVLATESENTCTRLCHTNEIVRFRDLHRKKLVWLHDRRPEATNLYIRYLLTRWCRKRFLCTGWENDANLVPRREAWQGFKELRRGVLRRLAYELGDCLSPLESKIASEPSIKSVLEECEDGNAGTSVPTHVEVEVAIRMADRIINTEDPNRWVDVC